MQNRAVQHADIDAAFGTILPMRGQLSSGPTVLPFAFESAEGGLPEQVAEDCAGPAGIELAMVESVARQRPRILEWT